jgi:lysophospholipase L1-like esterase
MKNRRRVLAATAALLVCAVPLLTLSTIAPSAQAAPTADSTAGLGYVALGDSYAAGYGLNPLTSEPVSGCGQSARDYPHQVASALRLDLTDVTCSSAVTADIMTAQVVGGGTAAPQDSALNSATRVVSLTIGGNDLGFSSIAAYCAALSPDGPLLLHPGQRNCRSHYTDPGSDNLQQRIAATIAPAVTAALARIRAKAPRAKVFVIGYPALAPDAAHTPAGGCFRSPLGLQPPAEGYPFTTVDVPFLFQTEQALDAAIRADTVASGYTFIPTFQASLSHTPCAASAEPAGTSWINGLSLKSLLPPSLQPGALHPNAAGVAYTAAQVSAAIKAAFPSQSPGRAQPASPGMVALSLIIAVTVTAVVSYLFSAPRTARRGRQSQQ